MSANALVQEMHPEFSVFSSSDGWFTRLKTRHCISSKRVTIMCQKQPDDKRQAIQRFHRSICRAASQGEKVRPLGKWAPSGITSVDQTPFSFTFSEGEAYTDVGKRTVWVCGGTSGLEKYYIRMHISALPMPQLQLCMVRLVPILSFTIE